MNVALLLVTHEKIAQSLMTIAQDVLNRPIKNIAAIEIPMDTSSEDIKSLSQHQLSKLDTNAGLLILTDLIGSTPYHYAHQLLCEHNQATLISGLNLPMLLKLENYRDASLTELTEKAILGGQEGITLHERSSCK